MADDQDTDEALAWARGAASIGDNDAAITAYLALLARDPTNADALIELAVLAHRAGRRTAARTALAQAVACHPRNAVARVNLGNLLMEADEIDAARAEFAAALAAQPAFALAHQGLARALSALGEVAAAAPHWRLGFADHAVVRQPFRGQGTGIPLLLLVSARGGNIPTHALIDDRTFAVIAVYADFFDPEAPLPPHALVFNAIGDADLCGPALVAARRIVARSDAPVINAPDVVAHTGRLESALRLGGLEGVRAPAMRELPRGELGRLTAFPMLLRSPGFHTGRHFVRVETAAALPAAVASLPGERLLAIEPLDARGPDGFWRKQRMMIIDGALYPAHLVVSPDWKAHHFSAGMADRADHRAEEARFLVDPAGVIGPQPMAALGRIATTLGLDYAGVDFAVAADGGLLLFEANPAMVLQPADPDPIWDYRRPALATALDAVRRMLLAKAGALS
ncbi:MAG TPA: tetratricopeptide repeat protein [Caulobacteraceae bacterium]|jgi:hypothetical protein